MAAFDLGDLNAWWRLPPDSFTEQLRKYRASPEVQKFLRVLEELRTNPWPPQQPSKSAGPTSRAAEEARARTREQYLRHIAEFRARNNRDPKQGEDRKWGVSVGISRTRIDELRRDRKNQVGRPRKKPRQANSET
jgi:hypothetical protein